ncbi:hypothetical protein BDV18DRAFT_11890 [Aspergillus unguis]
MSAQTTFYPTDPLDASIAPDSLFIGNGFAPEFLSLALLEKEDQQDMPMDAMDFQSAQQGTMPAPIAEKDEINRARLRNRALRPAPRDSRKGSLDMEMNQSAYYNSYPPMSNFSSFSFPSSDQDPDYRFEHDRVSPHSDLGSNKSSSPLRWHGGETEKRAKHLERNRAAASKSRQKKKRETDQLRTRFQEASRRKSDLEDEIKGLHSQLLSLKDQILTHSRCDDEAIHSYLGHMVKRATKSDSISSASTASTNETDEDRGHARQNSGSISPLQSHAHPKPTQPNLDKQVPVRVSETPGLPCGVEKPMMDQMFPQTDNIFDYQISIG